MHDYARGWRDAAVISDVLVRADMSMEFLSMPFVTGRM